MYSLRGVNIPCFGDYAFRAGCENGHLEIAKWLYSHGGVDIHSNYNYEFRFSCYKGHKHVSKWLYSLVSSTFKCDKYTFDWIHSEGKRDIVEWFNDIQLQVQVLSLLKTLLIQAIINPRPQSSLWLIEAGRKSKKVTIIGLNDNNNVKQIHEHQHIESTRQ